MAGSNFDQEASACKWSSRLVSPHTGGSCSTITTCTVNEDFFFFFPLLRIRLLF